MSQTLDAIHDVLASWVAPWLNRSLADIGAIAEVRLEGDIASVSLQLGFPCARHGQVLTDELQRYLEQLPGVAEARVSITSQVQSGAVQGQLQPLPGIGNVIAVASGKGGVGKSTVAANLALALHAEGARVGVLDADIYGPSQPTLFNTVPTEPPRPGPEGKFQPHESLGIRCMSMGHLVEPGTAMIWRGPMVTQALHQLLYQTRWGELDYLIVDLPPGTGDVQLTLSQKIPVSGAVVITTPQELSLIDARKAVHMFNKVEIRVLGIIENMSGFDCPACGERTAIFGEGGGRRLADEAGVRLLGSIPLNAGIRAQADAGHPTVASAADSDLANVYVNAALSMAAELSVAQRVVMPTIEMVD